MPFVCAVCRLVAPYVGAWIETRLLVFQIVIREVAPYVGAWIETCSKVARDSKCRSHPTWVRGLKLAVQLVEVVLEESHPTWVRGLKL